MSGGGGGGGGGSEGGWDEGDEVAAEGLTGNDEGGDGGEGEEGRTIIGIRRWDDRSLGDLVDYFGPWGRVSRSMSSVLNRGLAFLGIKLAVENRLD